MTVEHTEDGVAVARWLFQRTQDGGVRILVQPQAGGPVLTVSPTDWAEILAGVSATGPEAYHRALGVHQGEPT